MQSFKDPGLHSVANSDFFAMSMSCYTKVLHKLSIKKCAPHLVENSEKRHHKHDWKKSPIIISLYKWRRYADVCATYIRLIMVNVSILGGWWLIQILKKRLKFYYIFLIFRTVFKNFCQKRERKHIIILLKLKNAIIMILKKILFWVGLSF